MLIYISDSFDNTDNKNDEDAYEFASDLERKAAELEITVDYYMMEFM